MRNILSIFTILILISSCGFKVVDRSKLDSFDIVEITTSGEKRINYKLKNKLLFNSKKNEKKLIVLHLDTVKNKKIKEKNIKNEVTKYSIELIIKVKFKNLSEDIKREFTIRRLGEFNVSSQISQTANNEKKMIELLIEEISDEILNELINSINVI